MQGVQAINLSSLTFWREEAVVLLAKAFKSNIENLKHDRYRIEL